MYNGWVRPEFGTGNTWTIYRRQEGGQAGEMKVVSWRAGWSCAYVKTMMMVTVMASTSVIFPPFSVLASLNGRGPGWRICGTRLRRAPETSTGL